MAKPGLPKKYAKFGFKKGWRMFKAARKKMGGKIRKTFKRKKATTTKRKTVTRRKPAMAKTRKAAPRRRSRKRWNTATAGKIAIDSGVIGGSAIVSTMMINKAPMVKDWNNWQKALAQGLIGIFGLMLIPKKQIWVKKAAGGVAVGSALNFLLPYFPDAFKMSGKARPLTRAELNALTMGKPAKIMGKPAKIMGAPVNLMGGRFGKRGRRNYAGNY